MPLNTDEGGENKPTKKTLRKKCLSKWSGRRDFPAAHRNPTKQADSEFETTARGFVATSIGGRLAGMGGQYLIIDDPIKPGDVLSRGQRQNVNDWFHNTLGNYNFQAQYQQSPIPEKGNVINFDWFQRYMELSKNESGRLRIIQSWDTAMTAHDGSDYSVCITAQVVNKQYYIRDVFRKKLLFPDLVKEVKRLKSHYNAREVFIEDKASGVELIQLLHRQGVPGIQAIKPEGSKEDRIAAQSTLIENGRVFIPQSAPWIEEFKREVNAFPRGAHDDQLDALAQLLKREEEVGDKLEWLQHI